MGPELPDAAHAAEAARIKTQVAQAIHQAGTLKQQLGGMAARSQDALHPRLGLQPRFGGLLGNQTAVSIMDGSVAVVQLVTAAMASAP